MSMNDNINTLLEIIREEREKNKLLEDKTKKQKAIIDKQYAEIEQLINQIPIENVKPGPDDTKHIKSFLEHPGVLEETPRQLDETPRKCNELTYQMEGPE